MHPTEQFLHALVEANQHLKWDAAYLDALRCSINQQHQLTLKRIHIRMLPPELGLLQNLRQLSLYGTQMSAIPHEIVNLTNLKRLAIESVPLTSFPPTLPAIKSLYLWRTDIKKMPPTVLETTSLRDIFTFYSIPNPEPLREFKHLHSIWVRSINFEGCEHVIPSLKRLRKIKTDLWDMTAIPEEIFHLPELRHVTLLGSRLKTLPPAIKHLQKLCWFRLGTSQIITVPPEIGQLSKLQGLSLAHTPLQHLPKEIGQLKSLKELYLSHTQLTSLPAEISQLPNLEVLDLSNTPLGAL